MLVDFSYENLVENCEFPQDVALVLQQHREAVIQWIADQGFEIHDVNMGALIVVARIVGRVHTLLIRREERLIPGRTGRKQDETMTEQSAPMSPELLSMFRGMSKHFDENTVAARDAREKTHYEWCARQDAAIDALVAGGMSEDDADDFIAENPVDLSVQ